jgi:hypothetical protein
MNEYLTVSFCLGEEEMDFKKTGMNDSTDSGYGLLVELLKELLFSQEVLFHEVNFISFIILWLFKVITGSPKL